MPAKKENTISSSEAKVAEFKPQARWNGLRNKKTIIILAIIVVLLVAGSLIYHSWSRKQASKSANAVSGLNLTPTQKAQYLADKGNYKAAEQAWQDQLAAAKDKTTKIGIYYQQSSLAVRFKHYDDANKYAGEAKKLAPNTSTPYVALAQIAQAQGDKKAASQYWQQAINYLDPNSPTYNLKKNDYQSSLDSLK